MGRRSKLLPVPELANDICENLQKENLSKKGLKSLNKLPVDLADIYGICVACISAIEEMGNEMVWGDKRKLAKVITEIQRHLYVHLPNHYKSLEKSLEILLKEVDTDEYIMERLAATLKMGDEFLSKTKK